MEKIFIDINWQEILNHIIHWTLTTLPSIVLILIIGFLTVRFWVFLNRKILATLKNSALKLTEADQGEALKRADTLMGTVKFAGKTLIWSMLIMIILKKLSIDIGPILAGLGILGLAVGFGAQELVRDLVSGFFMLLENHLRTGDVAVINGTGGLVEKIGLRTITLRDLSGDVHIFQNGKINSLTNKTKEWSAIVLDIGVAYKENTDKVMEVMKSTAGELMNDETYKPLILEPIEIFGVDEFADSAVIIKARFKTKPIEQWNVGREYRRRLKHAFDREGIEIPFPHRTIYWGENAKPGIGN